ncbi:Hypothetical predicted protein [Mytilus galloprovincialis]|uniref:Uncharacterized protein n=1 Tax=Mytilus galloprovincialis TaxID=29158 RepID=A0A8B6DJ35_MYTGA|nr:Hypothetical predicted protein [Mytilus galloprovincialis]
MVDLHGAMNKVLRKIAAVLDTLRKMKTNIEKELNMLKFFNVIKGGEESPRNTYSKASGILATESDWKIQADVGGKTYFPRENLTTTL